VQSLKDTDRPDASRVAEDFFEIKPPVTRAPSPEAERGADGFRRQGLLERFGNAASRLGFVLSFLFLVFAALYALSLSGRLGFTPETLPEALDGAAASAGFAVDTVSIEGLKHLPEEDVHGALQLQPGRSLALYDTAAARRRLMALGWVRNAQVQRSLPDKLHVVITEREPYARWQQDADGPVKAIDRHGRILGHTKDSRLDGFVLLRGDGASVEAETIVEKLTVRPDVLARVEAAEWVAGRYWQLHLKDGLTAKLRRLPGDHALERLSQLLTHPDVSSAHIRTIDLRLAGRIVFELREQTPEARDRLIALLSGAPAEKARPAQRRAAGAL
jgi:cell division protein FtsQ